MGARAKRLWDLYRLTPETHQQILDYQLQHDFAVLTGTGRTNVDHRHSDGLVRGLLNWQINKGMGLIERAVAPDQLVWTLQCLTEFYAHPPAIRAIGPTFGLIGQAKYKRKMVYGGM